MNKQEQLELIRQKCIEANPEIESRKRMWNSEQVIRLADVLLAINKAQNVWAWDWVADLLCQTGYNWNLRKDDLTDQSDECITFLADLLK